MAAQLKNLVRDILARLLARFLRRFVHDPRYFDLWQRHGFHIMPLHFYSPVPDTRELSEERFTYVSALPGIDLNIDRQLEILDTIQKQFYEEYKVFVSRDSTCHPAKFRFGCGSIESVDAEVLYSMIRLYRPRRIIEIGAGYSTLIACEAAERNVFDGHPCEVVSIDPYPPDDILGVLDWPLDLHCKPVQDMPISLFEQLRSGDILFIDSSHVCRIGSDVHFELLEVLPRLVPGVVIHIHDIFLPVDYPEEWVKSRHRFWNEQYVLQAFLCGNRDFEILLGGAWMHHNYPELLEDAFPSYDRRINFPASFWIRKVR